MRILGLDLSLTSTGYCLVDDSPLDDGGAAVIWHGALGSSTLREAERLQIFDTWIRDHLAAMRILPPFAPGIIVSVTSPPIDHVAIEGYSYGSPQAHTRAFGIGELGGVIKLAIHQAGIPVHIIATNTWKKVLCGKGGLKKDLVRLELFKRYGVEFASQDTLDAWAVAMCLRRQLFGLDKPEPKTRKRKTVPPLIPAMEAAHADSTTGRIR